MWKGHDYICNENEQNEGTLGARLKTYTYCVKCILGLVEGSKHMPFGDLDGTKRSHLNHCYFCLIAVTGSHKLKQTVQYPNLFIMC